MNGMLGVLLFLWLLCYAHLAFADQSSGTFTGSDTAAVISSALVKAGAGNEVTVHVNEFRDNDQVTAASSSISADVDNLNFDKDHNSWKATLLFKANGRNLAPVSVSGSYDEMANVAELKHQIRAGEVITESDVEYAKESSAHLRKDIVIDAKDLIGKSPKRMISEHRPIHIDEIANQAILLKGSRITMIYRSANLEIKTIGEAMDNGGKGDVVRVKNLASKSIIEGVVESSDRVSVTSTENRTAEAM